jgi:hypothetical protein
MQMKNYIAILSFFLTVCWGCKEEYIGQYPVDHTPPAPVSKVIVENLNGKTIITYALPEEDDLLFVKAVYTSSTGKRVETPSSAYTNSVVLKGFGKSEKVQVQLISVDKSYNESTPVTVEIEPDDSPIYEIINTLVLIESFGGIKLSWKNPLGEEIVFGALMRDDEGNFKHIETIYSTESEAIRAIRGLDAKPIDFAFYIRDMYYNYTDTVYAQLTPLFETELDKSNFMALRISPLFTFHGYGGTRMSAMWDNIYNVDDNLCYLVGPIDEKIYFGFDMGIEAKVSRFRLWTRLNWMYQLHHIRYFEIWGTNDPAATTDPDSWDGWYKIMDCESLRPSGLAGGVPPTAEERELLLEGEEFEVSESAPTFRYMKIKVNETWTRSPSMFINEITIWGTPQ